MLQSPFTRLLCPLTAALALAGAALAAGTGTGDISGMDPKVAPGDEFYLYANGGWLAHTEIPADRSSYGPDAVLTDLTRERIAGLIKQAQSAPAGSPARQIGDYYAAYLDEARLESQGLEPLAAQLAAIAAIGDRRALATALGATLRNDVDVLNATNLHTDNLLGLWVAQDLDEPTRYAAFLLQGGLTMPDRDYYLNPSAHMAEIRTQFQKHIGALLTLAGDAQATDEAGRIYDLERRIAAVHSTRAESESVQKGNNHWARADFEQKAPGLDWGAFFAAAGLGARGEFVVWQPGAVTGIAALVGSEPLETWKAFLRFHLLEHYAKVLPKRFADENFAFNDRVLSGIPDRQARWKEAIDATNDALGEAVGRLYVERYFPPSEKARAEAMVKNLLAAFATRIDHLTWMAPQTRARAKAKLAALHVYVGYPDHWRSYQGLEVRRDDALGNLQRSELFDLHYALAKLGKPVDRSEWVMNPQLVNAVNLPAMNALNFPAAILQPPYFDPNRDEVMDYGATGATIGHEISHSFDDQGALFDATGKLANWWTPEDLAHFKAAGERLAAQFDAYHPFPDVAVNGHQTLSENIADVAGLAVAYDAWHLTLKHPATERVNGFTREQLFFLSYAQSWRAKRREEALRRQLVTDGHAPEQYRGDTVRNLDPWYPAYDVLPGQKLYLAPADRVRVW
ncbi:MAG: M13 family metallopeptidase [Gammaproteobacteria bacterium]|nr:M13 family metallopeptidase [Gammaproteobacteria bacterium]